MEGFDMVHLRCNGTTWDNQNDLKLQLNEFVQDSGFGYRVLFVELVMFTCLALVWWSDFGQH